MSDTLLVASVETGALVGLQLFGLAAMCEMELSGLTECIHSKKLFLTWAAAEAETEDFRKRLVEPTDYDLDCASKVGTICVHKFTIGG